MSAKAIRKPSRRLSARLVTAAAVAAAAAAVTACLVTIAPLGENNDTAPEAATDAGGDAFMCDGRCPPQRLDGGQLGSAPYGIYVTGTTVFFTRRAAGDVIDLDQASPIASELAGPVAVTGIGTSPLYWTMSGSGSGDAAAAGIGSLQNGTVRLRYASDLNRGAVIAPFEIRILDNGDLAWTSSDDDGGGIFRTTKDLQQTHAITSTTLGYNFMTTDGSHVWAATSGTTHAVYRIDTGSDMKTSQHRVYVNTIGAPGPIDWRAGKLYVSSYAGGYVGVIDDPLSDEQPLRLLVAPGTNLPVTALEPDGGPAVEHVFDLKTDQTFAYWTNKDNGAVVRVALGGGTPEAIAFLPEAGPSHLFITDDAVYFTALKDGNVYRLSK